jgi:hypothetical protein
MGGWTLWSSAQALRGLGGRPLGQKGARLCLGRRTLALMRSQQPRVIAGFSLRLKRANVESLGCKAAYKSALRFGLSGAWARAR